MQDNRKKILLTVLSVLFVLAVLVAATKPSLDANAVYDSIHNNPDFDIHKTIFFSVIAFTIAGFILAFHQERNYRKQKQDLGEYIAECERRGYSIDEITGILEKKGWIKKDIERFL